MVSEFHPLAIMPGQFFMVAFGTTATRYPEPRRGAACATETCTAETFAPTWFKGGSLR